VPPGGLGVGEHQLHASYTGDRRYAANDSASDSVTLGRGKPGLSLRVTGTMLPAAQAMTWATVALPSDATGNVSFTVDNANGKGITLGSAPIIDGSAIFKDLDTARRRLTPGANIIRASYAGDARYAAGASNPITVTVVPATG
jgi:hypothetical protein